MLKKCVFIGKNCKNRQASETPTLNLFLSPATGDPHPDPHVVTPTYYYNFVEFISSSNCVLYYY